MRVKQVKKFQLRLNFFAHVSGEAIDLARLFLH